MELLEPGIPPLTRGYLRCLGEAIDRTHGLFDQKSSVRDDTRIHAVKSILYAAIERAGMEAEQSNSVQKKLRELLFLVTSRADPLRREKQEALEILQELQKRFFPV